MKKILMSFAVFAVAGAAYVVFEGTSADSASLLTQNVEALGQSEGGGSSSSWTCWSQEKGGSGYWRCGNPCVFIDGASGTGPTSKCYK